MQPWNQVYDPFNNAWLSTIAPAARPAFLAAALVEGYLRAMERPGCDPLKTAIDMPRWRRLWRLWRASKNG